MPDGSLSNPYAVPQASLDEASGAEIEHGRRDPEALRSALGELDAHLADPAAVAADARLEGGFIPRGPVVAMAILLVLSASGLVLGELDADLMGFAILAWFGLFALAMTFITTAATSLAVGRRRSATDPARACRQHYRAMIRGRVGTVMAGLSPTARAQPVRPPTIPPLRTGTGLYRLDRPQAVKKLLGTFARSGHGQVRWARVVKVIDAKAYPGLPEVAVCRVQLYFRSWPQWANLLSFGLFLVLLPFVFAAILAIIIAAILYYALRRQRTLVCEKTFIRGSNGLWYAYCGEPIEQIADDRS